MHGRLTRAQKVKPNMAEIESILARHSQSPYVRGQLNARNPNMISPYISFSVFLSKKVKQTYI
jgi:hypothetical protein